MKKIFKVILLVFPLLTLVSCADLSTSIDNELVLSDGGMYSREISENVDESAKLISIINIDIETKELNEDLERIESKVNQLSGYISSHSVRTTQDRLSRKIAEMSIRIPTENAESFKQYVKDNLFIVSESSNTIDVTEKYYDLDSNIKNLESQEEQLREIYKRAESIEDVLAVTESLNEITREKELAMKEKESIDNKVSYSTFSLELEEVADYSVRHSSSDDALTRIKNAFVDLTDKIGQTLLIVALFTINALPFIVFTAIVVYVYNKHFKQKIKKRLEETEENTDD